MDNLALKINGQWAVLGSNCKISIDRTSPLWNESGTFSYPFPLPYIPNRHIFGILDLPESDRLSENIKYNFELYSQGMLILQGVLLVDEDPVDDTIGVHLTSGRSSFNDMIEGLKCSDIPLKDKVPIGGLITEFYYEESYKDSRKGWTVDRLRQDDLPEIPCLLMDANVDTPYPASKYCNVAIISSDGNIGQPNRSKSGVCFYLQYFLDCLFYYFNIIVDKVCLNDLEDFNRIAFFTTKCDYTISKDLYQGNIPDINSLMTITSNTVHQLSNLRATFAYVIESTNKNFPNENIDTLLKSLCDAFGIRLLFDEQNNNYLKIVFVKSILKNDIVDTLSCNISQIETLASVNGYRLSYGGGEDDTAYSYKDLSNKIYINSFNDLFNSNINLRSCYIDKLTGHAYRWKVDKDTHKNRALFEVGQFNSVEFGNTENKQKIEEIEIGFKPVIHNIINKTPANFSTAIFVDKDSGKEKEYNIEPSTYLRVGDPNRRKFGYNYKIKNWEDLQSFDVGLTLGIMRGSGSNSTYEIIETPNLDLGSKAYVHISGDKAAFTSDCIDEYGNDYDYNGNSHGIGPSNPSQRISLKLKATKNGETCSKYPLRGLVDQFLSEYIHFVINRKSLNIKFRLSLIDLINIDWTKKYKIGEYTGYFNKLSFDISSDTGLSLVEAEFYMI